MDEASRERALRNLDRRDWRHLGYAVAFLTAVVLLVVLVKNGLLPPAVGVVLLVVLLVAAQVLRFKNFQAQADRGWLDPMTRGERAVLAGAVLLAVPVVLVIRAAELPGSTELGVYVGIGLLVLAVVVAIDRRHEQRRKKRSGGD